MTRFMLFIKRWLLNLLMSDVVRSVVNPTFGKIDTLKNGDSICFVPAESNRLGDLIMHNHAMLQLRKVFNVTYGVTESFYARNREFLENHCMVDSFLILPKSKWRKLLFLLKVSQKGLKAAAFLPNPLISDLIFYLAGVPVISSIQGTARFATHHYDMIKFKNHYTSVSKCIIDALCKSDLPLDGSPFFPYKPRDIKLSVGRNYPSLSIHIGGASYWMRKWPREKYAAICKLYLKNYQGNLFLVGGQEEYEENENLRAILELDTAVSGRILNFCGADLNTFANVLASSSAFLGNDSGPMHMATALHTRVIAIFGPSEIPFLNPTDYNHRNITLHLNLDCVPCGNFNYCRQPDDKQFCCLSDLPTELVWESVRSVMA